MCAVDNWKCQYDYVGQVVEKAVVFLNKTLWYIWLKELKRSLKIVCQHSLSLSLVLNS